jgi:hypothetical protein
MLSRTCCVRCFVLPFIRVLLLLSEEFHYVLLILPWIFGCTFCLFPSVEVITYVLAITGISLAACLSTLTGAPQLLQLAKPVL